MIGFGAFAELKSQVGGDHEIQSDKSGLTCFWGVT